MGRKLRLLLLVPILVLAQLAFCQAAIAGDGWFGSYVRVSPWTNSRDIYVICHAHFDPVADGGETVGNMGWWINYISYSASTVTPWDPVWTQVSSDPQGEVGQPASITAGTHLTVSKGQGTKHVYALYKVGIVNFNANEPISPQYSDTTTLDTRPPVTYAPSSASGSKGTYIKLKFKVTDNLSPKARVVIKIKRGTTLKKTLKLGLRATGKLRSTSFKCDLPRGTYRFTVYATDLAGNRATTRGSNYLYVK